MSNETRVSLWRAFAVSRKNGMTCPTRTVNTVDYACMTFRDKYVSEGLQGNQLRSIKLRLHFCKGLNAVEVSCETRSSGETKMKGWRGNIGLLVM